MGDGRWRTIAALGATAWCLVLCGCRDEAPAVAARRSYTVTTPPAAITVSVGGRIEYRNRELVKAPVGEAILEWLIEDGLEVAPGDVVARFDVTLLDLWLETHRQELAILERRRWAASLASERNAQQLRAKLTDAQAEERALLLQYEESKKQDEDERAVLVRELDMAKTALAEAEAKLSAIRKLESLGGAAAREVRDAVMSYERQRANLRIPQVKLEVFDLTTGSTTRMLLDQELASVRLSLGEESDFGSLRAKLSLAVQEQAKRLMEHENAVAKSEEEAREYQAVVADPAFRTEAGGIVAERSSMESPVVRGAVLGGRSFMRVYPASEAIVEIYVPEEMRDALAAAREQGVLAEIVVPAMGGRIFKGRLTALSMTKLRSPPTYKGTVAFTEIPADLKVGATVDCRLAIPVGADELVVPRWWASADFIPRVRLAGGEERRLHSRRCGDWLLVQSGLALGEELLPPPREGRENLILRGTVEVPNTTILKIVGRPWEWVLEELVDDGAEVEEGDVVATLRPRRGSLPTAEAADLAELKAEASKQLAELAANGAYGDEYLKWQEAEIAADKARLNYLIERYVIDDEGVVSAAVDAELKALSYQEEAANAERLAAPVYEDVVSEGERRRQVLEAMAAKAALAKASRAAVAARHYRQWSKVWEAKQAYYDKRLAAETAQQAYQAAKAKLRKDVAAAEADYQAAMRVVDKLRERAGATELRAPISGRIYHNNRLSRPLEVGRGLRTSEPLEIPGDNLRRFSVDVPARLYGELKTGDEVAFYLPAEGGTARKGRVRHVADFFERVALDGEESEGDAVASESTVRIQVEFSVKDAIAAPPGTTAVMELAL